MVNAQVVRGIVASIEDPEQMTGALRSASNARAVVQVDDVWYASVVEFSESLIPASVHAQLDAAGSAAQRVVLNGDPYLVIGVQLPGVEARYVEFVPLAEYARTMETLGAPLAAGAAAATAG